MSVKYHPAPFVELEEIAKQILALTKLNYKTLSPTVGEPVTLLFANLVAKFTAVFSETQWKNAACGRERSGQPGSLVSVRKLRSE